MLYAEWHFFGTSDGKSPCNGISGKVKRIISKSSLQERIILMPLDLFNYGNENIKIKFFWVGKQNVDDSIGKLNIRFSTTSTVLGTRTHHAFVPIDDNSLLMKNRTSSDSEGSLIKMFEIIEEKKYQSVQYVAAVYDKKWYVGIILEKKLVIMITE